MSYIVRYWIDDAGEIKEFYKNQQHKPERRNRIRFKTDEGQELEFRIRRVVEVTEAKRQGLTTHFDCELTEV